MANKTSVFYVFRYKNEWKSLEIRLRRASDITNQQPGLLFKHLECLPWTSTDGQGPEPEWDLVGSFQLEPKLQRLFSNRSRRTIPPAGNGELDVWKCTPLIAASCLGLNEAVRCLLKFETENGQCSKEGTALQWAAYFGHEEICVELLKKEKLKSTDGALHAAIRGRRPKVVETLLKHPQIDPELLLCTAGQSPLEFALALQCDEIIMLLIQCPRVDLKRTDCVGYALDRKNIEMLKTLLQRDIPISKQMLIKAAESGDKYMFRLLAFEANVGILEHEFASENESLVVDSKKRQTQKFYSDEIKALRSLGSRTKKTTYDLEGTGGGDCLIINIENFDEPVDNSKTVPNRIGSKYDVGKIEELCQYLNVNVTKITSESKIDLKTFDEKLNRFWNTDFTYSPLLMVFIMSHGTDDGDFILSDHKRKKIEGIIQRFSQTPPTGMQGKPKLFFINACRGQTFPLPATIQTDSKAKQAQIYNDVMVAFSTIPGYVSFREDKNGSFFIQVLCSVFKKNASHLDLASMMDLVMEEMQDRQNADNTEDYKLQTPCVEYRGFWKKLYFSFGGTALRVTS